MADTNSPLGYIIVGQVIDKNKQPISGAKITSTLGDTTTTTPDGEFNLIGEYTPGEIFKINIFAKDFAQKNINPFTLSKKFKNQGALGIITLKDAKTDLRQSIDEQLPLTDSQMKLIKASKMDVEMAKQQAMNNLIKQIKIVLIPQVLTLIAQFGITKATEALGKKFGDMNATCPANLDELNALIKKKNKLTKALNNIMGFLDTIKVGVQVLDTTITVAQIVVEVLNKVYLPFPVAGFGVPDLSKLIKENIDIIRPKLKEYKLISSSTLLVLTLLIGILQQILNYLSLLDSLIQGCAIEGQLPQEQLSKDLLEATQQQSQQQSPVVTNVNGFEMGVISVKGITDESLKRRRAVARNKAGVIMLQGEPSFSSNDQILIDELVFYIKQNDLKAD